MVRNGVMWVVREGRECLNCVSGQKRCLWRDGARDTSRWATTCYHCNHSKKSCGFVRDTSETVEGGSLKKRVRTTVEKGKGKEKEAEQPVASRSRVIRSLESGSVEVLKRILAEIQGMRTEMRVGIAGIRMELGEIQRSGKKVVKDVGDIVDHFYLDEGNSVAGNEAENDAENDAEEVEGTLQ